MTNRILTPRVVHPASSSLGRASSFFRPDGLYDIGVFYIQFNKIRINKKTAVALSPRENRTNDGLCGVSDTPEGA